MRPDAVFRLQRPHARWSCDVFRKCVCPSAEMGVSGFVLPQSWNSHGNKIFRTQLERGNWQQRLLQSTDGGRSICGSRTVVIETERTPCASSLTLDLIIKTYGHKKKKNWAQLLSRTFGPCCFSLQTLVPVCETLNHCCVPEPSAPVGLSSEVRTRWNCWWVAARPGWRLHGCRVWRTSFVRRETADEFKASGASLKTNAEIKLQLFSCALL